MIYLDNTLDHGSDVRQHDGETVRSLRRLQFRSIVRAGAISRAQVEGVSGCQLELRRRGLHVRNDSVKERLLCLFEELQYSRQDRIRASRLSIVLRKPVNN